MTVMFSESCENAMFRIEYSLEVFIKHNSKMEFGMGNSVVFPVQVRGEAFQVPFLQTRVHMWQELNNIPDW